ncbi:MAG: hypothetical protein ACOYYS_25240 [Chloroflexota bacterium]
MLALLTCVTAIVFGWWMQRRGLGKNFRFKLRLSFGVVLAQTVLTLVCPAIITEMGLLAWLHAIARQHGWPSFAQGRFASPRPFNPHLFDLVTAMFRRLLKPKATGGWAG